MCGMCPSTHDSVTHLLPCSEQIVQTQEAAPLQEEAQLKLSAKSMHGPKAKLWHLQRCICRHSLCL